MRLIDALENAKNGKAVLLFRNPIHRGQQAIFYSEVKGRISNKEIMRRFG